MWLPVDGSDAPKIPSGKGKRLIVFHAGNREEGLIDRCDLVFLANAKDGDYHQEMNGPILQKDKGSLGEGRGLCIKNRKGVWERE
jgi:hypothetical protein